jgi:hypothetical protein
LTHRKSLCYIDNESREVKKMSMQPKPQLDPFEQLKKILGDAPRNHDSLAEYVGELEKSRQEEDIFIRLAFQNASVGGAFGRGDTFVTSVYSQLYDEPLDVSQKQEVRLWWHDKVRHGAEKFDDLGARLARLRS